MTLANMVTTLAPLFASKVIAAVAPALLSAPIAAFVGLWTYRHQSKELIDGAVTWTWTFDLDRGPDEAPFLAVQNRSAVPAYLVRVRYRRGVFFRAEASRYALSYDNPTDGSFPLEVKAQGVTSFPLSSFMADEIVGKASLASRCCAYLTKRPYLWIEITTLSRRTMTIPANDVTSWRKRPRWLEGRWFAERTA